MMRVFTIDEAAKEVRVSRSTISRLIAEGRIRCVRTGHYGGRVLISERALEAFVLGKWQAGETGDGFDVGI